VPDPEFPFLGVHFTPRMVRVDMACPKRRARVRARRVLVFHGQPVGLWTRYQYPGFIKLATKYWKIGAGECIATSCAAHTSKDCNATSPSCRRKIAFPADRPACAAQAMRADGSLEDDFVFDGDEHVVHVRKRAFAPATSSLAIGKYIVEEAGKTF